MPENDPPLSDQDSTSGNPDQTKPKHARFFSPTKDGPGLNKQAFTNVVSPVLKGRGDIEEDIESPLEDAQAAPQLPREAPAATGGGSRFRREEFPQMMPEKTSAIYAGVTEFEEPERWERRFSRSVLITGILLLVALVAFVYISTFHFGSSDSHASGTQDTTSQESALTPRTDLPLSADEAKAQITQALTILQRFVSATTLDARQELLPANEPLPAFLQTEGAIAQLQNLSIDSTNARLRLLDSRAVALIPITDEHGFQRTAALLGHEGRFTVDWRSFLTPETQEWEAFFTQKTSTPALFRVRINRSESGAISVSRPDETTPHSVKIEDGSRLSSDVTKAFNEHPGLPMDADAYLVAEADGTVRLTGLITDKWRL